MLLKLCQTSLVRAFLSYSKTEAICKSTRNNTHDTSDEDDRDYKNSHPADMQKLYWIFIGHCIRSPKASRDTT